MSYLAHTENFNGIMDVYMNDAKRYLPLAQLTIKIMESDSELSSIEKEAIALRVSVLNNCAFCVGSHGALLGMLGVDADQIDVIKEGNVKDERLQAILAFADDLAKTPQDIDQSGLERLRTSNLSDQTIEDIIAVVSLFSFVNRLLNGLGVEGNEEEYAKGAQFIANAGYSPAASMLAK